MRFKGIGLEENGALEFRIASELRAQLVHLLRDISFHVAITPDALLVLRASETGVLRRQSSQKCSDEIHIAVRQMELRIIFVEHQCVTRLAIRSETDPLIEPASWFLFVAVIAIELLPVHWRDIVGKMALVIEAQDVGVARFLADELEFRVRIGE